MVNPKHNLIKSVSIRGFKTKHNQHPLSMTLNHPTLRASLQKAYSAEKAAALAYIGHAASLKDPKERTRVKEIEQDEWDHRNAVNELMQLYDIPVSKYYEFLYTFIGKSIRYSCYLIGRFMPYFFAGKQVPSLISDYDAIGFDMDHCLASRNGDELMKLLITS